MNSKDKDREEKKLAVNNPGVNDNLVVTPPMEDKGKNRDHPNQRL